MVINHIREVTNVLNSSLFARIIKKLCSLALSVPSRSLGGAMAPAVVNTLLGAATSARSCKCRHQFELLKSVYKLLCDLLSVTRWF